MSTSSARKLADIVQRVSQLELAVAALQRARGPRDAEDAEVLPVLARQIGGRTFSSRELLEHAEKDPEVKRVLDNAGLTTVREIGCYLRRMRDVPLDGRTIRRDGRRWCVQVAHVNLHAVLGSTLAP